MCGRYSVTLPPEAMRGLFRTTNPLPNIQPRWNLAPTQQGPVVRRNAETGERSLDLLRWGLLPSWCKDARDAYKMINAKAETVRDKPSFRQAFAKRRCLVPATAYYEWMATGPKDKQPYAIGLASGEPMVFAGLWENWRDPAAEGDVWIRTYTIITTDAAASVAHIHNRMPAVLPPEAWATWLGEDDATTDAVHALLQPSPPDALTFWPVAKAVGNVRNEGAELLHPITPPAA
ncbi:SOS response-associated peptidase [Nitrospirillum sp. BR 11163]|uniref:SOS response-associated peptidase n=1 Tax=Nitrospirillum sp. BR 11163 TaxID=3104323 RepID=UPI002AFFEF34|nr:SOS response-associated peptidase [Nitrospirillum sp. BR 11163]MEA1674123.1 SOS response-associated peptidase [Nitrospirillum sp. BR 11163]